MNTEQFEKRQSEMSNAELAELVQKQISELAKTGGKSHKMCVPPMITDTDMLLGEMLRRFKILTDSVFCSHCHKYKKMQGNGILHQLCECAGENVITS